MRGSMQYGELLVDPKWVAFLIHLDLFECVGGPYLRRPASIATQVWYRGFFIGFIMLLRLTRVVLQA